MGRPCVPSSPDWYPDPSGEPRQRYWDGREWTSQVRPYPAPRDQSHDVGDYAGVRFPPPSGPASRSTGQSDSGTAPRRSWAEWLTAIGGTLLAVSPFLAWERVALLGDVSLPQVSRNGVVVTGLIVAAGAAIVILSLSMRRSRTAAAVLVVTALVAVGSCLLLALTWMNELEAAGGFAILGIGPVIAATGALAAALGSIACLVRAYTSRAQGASKFATGVVVLSVVIGILWALGIVIWWFAAGQSMTAQPDPADQATTGSPASRREPASQTTQITLHVTNCEGCAAFVDNIAVDPPVFAQADVVGGQAVFNVPTSATAQLGFGLNLPDEGGNTATVIVLGFPGVPSGTSIPPGSGDIPTSGSTCWAGTQAPEADIYIEVRQYPDPQIDGSPGHSGIAYAVPTLPTLDEPSALDSRGGASTQEVACYP